MYKKDKICVTQQNTKIFIFAFMHYYLSDYIHVHDREALSNPVIDVTDNSKIPQCQSFIPQFQKM